MDPRRRSDGRVCVGGLQWEAVSLSALGFESRGDNGAASERDPAVLLFPCPLLWKRCVIIAKMMDIPP